LKISLRLLAYGYVRFFHPNDYAARVDWDAMAILGIDVVAGAMDDSALRSGLLELFSPVTSGLRISPRWRECR